MVQTSNKIFPVFLNKKISDDGKRINEEVD